MVENEAYFGMVRRMITAGGRRVRMADPEDLADLVACRITLEASIQDGVDGLRDAGFTWDSIATVLGVTKQAVIQRYGNVQNKGHRRIDGE